MLRCQFLCHVLKALFFIKITLKLSYFCKKMENFQALGAPPPEPHTPIVLRRLVTPPQTPKTTPHFEFLAKRLELSQFLYRTTTSKTVVRGKNILCGKDGSTVRYVQNLGIAYLAPNRTVSAYRTSVQF